MKIYSFLFSLLFAFASTFSVSASDFFDTGAPDHLFSFGIRAGVNTSNRTLSKKYISAWNVNSWGTGFDTGLVVDINLRQYLSIQPGFFYESRSGNYAYMQNYIDFAGADEHFIQLGKSRSYFFTIPVMCSLRFNLSSNVKWIAELGPYAQMKLHSSENESIYVIHPQTDGSLLKNPLSMKTVDVGLKIGTGIQVAGHYSFNIHYLAGGNNVWKEPYKGGKNKAWAFTLGYDF
ncbi:MAG: PorT family protein [Muribaculaceae bacterium]|nr:PorT family protein [Muribaculaceae bacterium]